MSASTPVSHDVVSRVGEADLGSHVRECADAGTRLHGLLCAAEALNGFVSSRFVTTLVLFTAVAVAGVLFIR